MLILFYIFFLKEYCSLMIRKGIVEFYIIVWIRELFLGNISEMKSIIIIKCKEFGFLI